MKRIYVSTVGRGKQKEESSKIYCIDVDTEQIVASVRLPLSMLDLANPRGGCRGGRGLCFAGNTLLAAGYDGIFELDTNDLFIKRGWWSKEIGDIHQIYPLGPDGNGCYEILITDTLHNSLYTFANGKFLKIHDFNKYNHLGLPPPQPDHPDHLHLNSVLYSEKLGLICRSGKIFNWETGQVLCDNPEYLQGSHDLVRIKSGEICVNNSRKHRVVAFNEQWEPRVLLQLGDGPRSELAVYGWVRGMSYFPKEDILLCGNAPAEVLILTGVSGVPSVRKIKISDEIVESVFDVVPHPLDWQ